jgi:hypothetical protein
MLSDENHTRSVVKKRFSFIIALGYQIIITDWLV